MPLNLNDLMKKAKDKGITSTTINNTYSQIVRPWQQESTLFEKTNKLATNRQQIGIKTGNKPTTGEQQTDNKPDLSGNKPTTKSVTQQTTNQQQIDNNLATNISFSSLVGLQRAIMIFVYNHCKMAGAKTTESLTLEHIGTTLNASKGCVKTTIQRLESKGFIKRAVFKNGRGGWSRYTIPDLLFQELLQYETCNKLATNWQQTDNQSVTKLITQPITQGPIVSSNYINNTTIPDEFRKIDCSPLSDIKFDESHIIQIYREYMHKPELALAADIIQNSINALSFDLKYNNVASSFKISPAVVLTSMLKKGQPYSSKTPEKVLTPKEEALREYLLAQEQKNAKMLEIENKTKNFALQEWLNSLPEEELFNFNDDGNVRPEGMPEKIYQTSRRKKALVHAKEYFDNVVWPKKLKEILGEPIKQEM